MTKLDKPLRREVEIEEVSYTLTLTREGLRLTQKGRRIGLELKWKDLVTGDAALAVALRASQSLYFFCLGKRPDGIGRIQTQTEFQENGRT